VKHSQYSEFSIARHLAREKFNSMMLVVDNTYHTGHEADLLIVNHRNLHYIDVEIKISRADLKADRLKDKWLTTAYSWPQGMDRPAIPREWPRRIWKHYYCIAEPIWKPELLEFVGKRSGVFTIRIDRDESGREWYKGITVRKRCQANPDAKRATPEEIVKLAYLANVRMHEAYRRLDEMRELTTVSHFARMAAAGDVPA
jgi:hypothetical protein